MLPIKCIVCPTDFSEPSRQGLEVAQELARHFGAELVLVHVVDPVPVLQSMGPMSPTGTAGRVPFNVSAYQELLKQNASEQLEALAQERVAPEVVLSKVITLGKPEAAIVELAAKVEADLIVIATHGRTGVRRFLFGSVAEKVVRTAGCPVLTIQAEA
jgi:nucleotide-binding universal stress UspA family protein